MKKTILAITAHADDHITFAGTVMKLQQKGYDYYELVITKSDEGGDYKTRENKTDNLKIADIRKRELEKAAKFLKTKELLSLDQPDQNLVYNKELMHQIVEVIRRIKPSIGIGMNTIDVHPDHIQTAILAKEAFRWASKNFRRELGQPHRTNLVLFAEGTQPINPSFLVDISEFYNRKEELFKIYESQASPSDMDLMKSFALIRGYHLRKSGAKFAEAFSVEQNILPILFE